MSRLNELIQEFCPNGVEFKQLSDILKIKNGSDYKSFLKGNIPVYGSGGIIAYIDRFAYNKPSVLIPRKGSINKLYYVDTPFWTVDTIFYTQINVEFAEPKFVYFCLQMQHLERLNTAGGVPSLTQNVLNRVRIPVPPLNIQNEIVRILDNFTELTAELIAELTARKKQYEYYRNKLLTFDHSVKWMTIGEICKLSAGGDIPKEHLSKEKTKEYNIPIYSNGIGQNALYGYTDIAKITKPCVTIAARGTIGYSELHTEPFYPVVRLICAIPNSKVLPSYLNYFIQTLKFNIPKSGIPQLTVPMVEKYKIPVPSLNMQQKIVNVLDNFDSICTDLNIGLPAEIEARQKQYEYYRDVLLTFTENKDIVFDKVRGGGN